MTEPASLVVPLIIGFGSAFGIALGGGAGERRTSLMAGLHPGPVAVRSDGSAACVQLDLTPLGAVRLLGGAAADLAGRMAPIEDVRSRDARELPGRLAEARGWCERLELLERFVAERLRHEPSPTVAAAFGRLAAAGGDLSVTALAGELGVSRTGLSRRFTAEIGVGPKAVARVMRFARAPPGARGPRRGLGRPRRALRLRRTGPPRARVPPPRGREPRRLDAPRRRRRSRRGARRGPERDAGGLRRTDLQEPCAVPCEAPPRPPARRPA